MQATIEKSGRWLEQPLGRVIAVNWETIIFTCILLLGIISRFYDLESRVMSHDETSHVYFSWLFSEGRGYQHDPVTHGPLQFHLVAFSYFLFGDNDLTARIPAVIFSIATIAFMWNFRRILGQFGALIGAGLFVISPYILYYGRYVRNEAFVGLLGLITIWGILRYLATGSTKYLYWLTAATALHFTTKETSFIYQAQAMLFLAGCLIVRLAQYTWQDGSSKRRFLSFMAIGFILFVVGGIIILTGQSTLGALPAGEEALEPVPFQGATFLGVAVLVLGLICLVGAAYYVISGFSWGRLKGERVFSLLVVLTTMVLPMLAPFPVKLMGLNPIDYGNTQTMLVTGIWIVVLAIIAVGLGFLWNWRLWLINAGLFYGIFTIFYTSIFTNGFGFITGLVGSLGYWLEQQGVNRGSQPWYYYWLIQIPIYEFLPALGTIGALLVWPWIGRQQKNTEQFPDENKTPGEIDILGSENMEEQAGEVPEAANDRVTVALLLFWSFSSLVAYTIAGEKMPWLTFHIAVPMILTAAWFLGWQINKVNWQHFQKQRGVLLLILLPILFASLLAASGSLLGNAPPFQGKELEKLRATSTFLSAIITAIVSGWIIARVVRDWTSSQFARICLVAGFAMLALLTARTAFQASYINYDNATEYLVYAHSASGPKKALAQIEEISQRTTDGLALKVAYDSDTTYPYWWYLRNYTNQDFYGTTPSRAQRDDPVILVGENNFGKIEPVVGDAYHRFDYIRLWWPNQDYFGLTRERILNALSDPSMRAALFDIWLNRDHTLYGQVTNKDMSLPNWQPSSRMRLYVRKDIVASIWNYGVSPTVEEIVVDPFEEKRIDIQADIILGTKGSDPGQFNRPRGIAVAPDGTIYVTDTDNHRIQHLDIDGSVLEVWGSYADSSQTEAPGGTFSEPWGIAVGPDGFVYVTDTWNHRIQKFTSQGGFVNTWGFFGQAETPFALWGPRDIAVDRDGRVFVSDTGNKRIVVFNREGEFITEFGGAGLSPGQFDEPVGIALDSSGNLYVADTWNQRVQVFDGTETGNYQPLREWEVPAWYGQSLDNKPYLAVSDAGRVFVGDPEGYRVLLYTEAGEEIGYFGDLSNGSDGFTLVGGVSVAVDGGIWVSDTGNDRLMHFTLP